jgi:hypothetical protein
MTSDLFLIHVGTALHSWLNYVSAVERGYVLAENSIIYPVSEFIGTKTTGIDEILLDRVHPNLKGKRLDLRFFTNLDGLRHEVAMEFKYARQGYTEDPGEKQRILNDILRLKLFTESNSNRKAYFLICGEQIDFLKAFQSIGWSTNADKDGRPYPKEMTIDEIKDLGVISPYGFYTNWFKFDPLPNANDNVIDITINDKKVVPDEYLKGFYTEYKDSFKDGMSVEKFESTKVQTRLVYLSELSNLAVIKNLMRVGIWEISSV